MFKDNWKQTACKYTFMHTRQTATLTHTLTHLMEWNCAGMEAAWKWCNWLFQFSVLTLAVPSSFRLMMSKSKSLLRPSVLLRTMCPVSPSHCAYRGEAMGERSERRSRAQTQMFLFFWRGQLKFWKSFGEEVWLRTWRKASAGDKNTATLLLLLLKMPIFILIRLIYWWSVTFTISICQWQPTWNCFLKSVRDIHTLNMDESLYNS